jgi:hypothetical protein
LSRKLFLAVLKLAESQIDCVLQSQPKRLIAGLCFTRGQLNVLRCLSKRHQGLACQLGGSQSILGCGKRQEAALCSHTLAGKTQGGVESLQPSHPGRPHQFLWDLSRSEFVQAQGTEANSWLCRWSMDVFNARPSPDCSVFGQLFPGNS